MVNISEEERERRRQNMLRLHEEGRAGAEYGKMGGRPRKPRASEQIAERVSQDADLFYEKLIKIVEEDPGKNAITAIQTLLKTEEQERKIVEAQEERIDKLRREELLELVRRQLEELGNAGTIERVLSVGEPEVIRDERPSGASEELGGIEETISD